MAGAAPDFLLWSPNVQAEGFLHAVRAVEGAETPPTDITATEEERGGVLDRDRRGHEGNARSGGRGAAKRARIF
jgi:hypothetical protein